MTTKVHSTYDGPGNYVVVGSAASTSNVYIAIASGGEYISLVVPRAVFLDAVASELDAITIPREGLPEVKLLDTLDGEHRVRTNGYKYRVTHSAEVYRRIALRNLAIAEYVKADPPVDEEQVAAMTEVLSTVATSRSFETFARRLYAAGMRMGGDDK